MAAKNDITGAEIKTSALSKEGRENFDDIFAKRTFEEWAEIENLSICIHAGRTNKTKISYSEFLEYKKNNIK
jgi:hypothetical protein